ncbi:unnamed protein product [Protopolystoma xenopodis]|uniref:Uncharacterized protein n=1 Tax=Protopolystoma xenopodis TaxID=117903 RepID=A0A448X383_9PLAT|nr:unnamed protein product [Protopolystoma xenopodis]
MKAGFLCCTSLRYAYSQTKLLLRPLSRLVSTQAETTPTATFAVPEGPFMLQNNFRQVTGIVKYLFFPITLIECA